MIAGLVEIAVNVRILQLIIFTKQSFIQKQILTARERQASRLPGCQQLSSCAFLVEKLRD